VTDLIPFSFLGRRFLRLIWVLMLLCGSTASAAVDTSTNWVPLTDLQNKWDPVPMPEVQKAAEQGDVHAMHYLGYCFGEGLRVARDANQSLAWYKRGMQGGYLSSANNIGMLFHRELFGTNGMNQAAYYYKYAAERGLDQSQANLGALYRDGNGVPQDFTEAMHWFQLAAAKGHPAGMVGIGRLYRFGQGVESNLDEAMRWFTKAVNEKDSPLAKVNIASLYESQGQIEKAIALYKQAAEQGSVDAMNQLYSVYWNGSGVPVDHAKALEWKNKAGATGNPQTEFQLGDFYETRRWEGEGAHMVFTAPNWPLAFHWYRLAAEHNSAEAKHRLGMLYISGKGVDVDESRGLELVRAAADQGVRGAMHDLAQCYGFGIGEPRNDADRPIELLRRSKSWDELISRYEVGYGTERDLVAAAECYTEAARALQPWIYTLSDKLEFHPGIPIQGATAIQSFDDRQIMVPIPYKDCSDDLRHALSLYLKSAKGDGQAALQIANRYLNGLDTPQSSPRAWAWFKIAAQYGASEADAKAKQIDSRLTSAELKAGEQERARQMEQLRRLAAEIAK
jgi:TPR repeat protein